MPAPAVEDAAGEAAVAAFSAAATSRSGHATAAASTSCRAAAFTISRSARRLARARERLLPQAVADAEAVEDVAPAQARQQQQTRKRRRAQVHDASMLRCGWRLISPPNAARSSKKPGA